LEEGLFNFTKLSGKHDTYDAIGVVRFPVVHVRTLRVNVANVDEVAVRRLLSLLSSLCLTRKKPKASSLYIIR